MKKYEEFIHDRFEQYYVAWKDSPIDESHINARQNFNVVLCFIRCCFVDRTEFLKFAKKNESVIFDTSLVVVRHYKRFLERVQSILSRY